jgi:hypothetical protein
LLKASFFSVSAAYSLAAFLDAATFYANDIINLIIKEMHQQNFSNIYKNKPNHF